MCKRTMSGFWLISNSNHHITLEFIHASIDISNLIHLGHVYSKIMDFWSSWIISQSMGTGKMWGSWKSKKSKLRTIMLRTTMWEYQKLWMLLWIPSILINIIVYLVMIAPAGDQNIHFEENVKIMDSSVMLPLNCCKLVIQPKIYIYIALKHS